MNTWPFTIDSMGGQFGGPYGNLMNRWSTILRFSRRANADDALLLFDRMDELGVPFSYADELEEIYFTILPGKHGQYSPCEIQLSVTRDSRLALDRTLIHELGHHLDNVEDISERPSVIREKREGAKTMLDPYANTSVSEYVAVGFEVYYVGTRVERARMRRHNPKLYRIIADIHRKYSKR